jgi:hypothetical protein
MLARIGTLVAFLAVGTASGQALAEPTGQAGSCRTQAMSAEPPHPLGDLRAEREQDLTLQCAPAVLRAVDELAPAELESHAVAATTPGAAERRQSADERALRRYMRFGQDLRIPGSSAMAVRLIPTRTALVGIPSPVVFIPRVVRSSWYGMEVVVTL